MVLNFGTYNVADIRMILDNNLTEYTEIITMSKSNDPINKSYRGYGMLLSITSKDESNFYQLRPDMHRSKVINRDRRSLCYKSKI